MSRRKGCRRYGILIMLVVFLAVLYLAAGKNRERQEQPKTYPIRTQSAVFTESPKMLSNPNRGFYHMYGFTVSDEETDYQGMVAQRFCYDTETALTLVEINLKEYRDGPVSEQGLANVEKLFTALSHVDKQLILRFLYDWDGKNEESEPDSREVILTHMKQMEPYLKAYADQIFAVQGLFVGDYGEMHHSRFLSDEDIKVLAEQFAAAVGESTYLAVRTPVYWRRITGIPDSTKIFQGSGPLSSRMGLFNDGMLGSNDDCGTYGDGSSKEEPYAGWNREEELEFQNILCRLVPNGGEVIIDNSCNDLENAVNDLASMHVTYINCDYDGSVLEKWAGTTVSEDSCFDGMDGLTYMERHLGYRLVIQEAKLDYRQEEAELSVEVALQNVGFAPVYREVEARAVLYDTESGRIQSYLFSQDVRELFGGTDAAEILTLQMQIPSGEIPSGSWEIYLDLTDRISGERIFFGNEQEPDWYGYWIGSAVKEGGAESD